LAPFIAFIFIFVFMHCVENFQQIDCPGAYQASLPRAYLELSRGAEKHQT
jgi:hypothetical protein